MQEERSNDSVKTETWTAYAMEIYRRACAGLVFLNRGEQGTPNKVRSARMAWLRKWLDNMEPGSSDRHAGGTKPEAMQKGTKLAALNSEDRGPDLKLSRSPLKRPLQTPLQSRRAFGFVRIRATVLW